MNSTALFNSVDIFRNTYRYLRESHRSYADVENLKTQWAAETLQRLNVDVKVTGRSSNAKSVIFVGNHISYLDIPLIMSAAPKLSFVAKQELSQWPIFGSAARRIDTVFVKRENGNSRKSARLAVQRALEFGKRVVIFPSGTTCLGENKSWRKGAFEIARDLGIYIQPFRISYSPLRTAAYIDDDFFPTHLYQLSKVKHIEARIEFHDLITVNDADTECVYWQKWSRGLLLDARE